MKTISLKKRIPSKSHSSKPFFDKGGAGSSFSKTAGTKGPFFIANTTEPVVMKSPSSSKRLPTPLKTGIEGLSGMDMSDVNVNYNSSKPAQLQAHAFAQGTDIHLGPNQEQYLAHEAWHVVQQKQNRVNPSTKVNGARVNDDKGLESEADKMGRKAMQMKVSSNQYSPKNGAPTLQKGTSQMKSSSPIQMVKSNWGEFKEKNYNAVASHGVNIEIEFHPQKDKVDATKIGLTQTVNNQLGGNDFSMNPTRAEQRVQSGVGKGDRIDRISTNQNPIYGGQAPSAGHTLEDTTTGSNAQVGWHYFDNSSGTPVEKTQEAILKDKPTMPGSPNNSSQTFETAALAIKGTQKGQYMGSVEWGWKKDGSGAFSKLPFKIKTESSPTAGFFAAGEQWNKSKAQGTIKVSANPAQAYKWSSGAYVADSYTLAKGTEVTLEDDGAFTRGPGYNKVKIVSGAKAGTITRLRVQDMKDQQDGAATLNLPIEDIKLTTAPITQVLGGVTGPALAIPTGTRVKIVKAPVGTGEGILKIVGNDYNGLVIHVTKTDFSKLKNER